MTQVRKEYLRWIETHFWNTAKFASLPEPELRVLPYLDRPRFRQALKEALKELPFDRFIQLRDEARIWLCSQSLEEQKKVLKEYDELLMCGPPDRINWSAYSAA